MRLALLVQLAGAMQFLIGVGHVGLPKQLGWPHDIAASTPMTVAVSYVHTFFIGLTCAGFGIFSLGASAELVSGRGLGQTLSIFLALFWAARLVIQTFVFRPVLWTTNLFKAAHVMGSVLWMSLTLIYLVAATQ
jgi:hypothetical protein